MFETSLTNKRIAKNTLLLYFRMIFMMLVSLYTSRVILEALGVEDFGVYNVVGEEAGTKLLLPLFLMLGVVMIMIVVPAFLAIY